MNQVSDKIIVIDLGTGYTKVGFAGEEKPQQCVVSKYNFNENYHYPPKSEIQFEEIVLNEACYKNLNLPNLCLKCNSGYSELVEFGGPARTQKNYLKVFASVYQCKNCRYAYVNIDVVE